MELGDILRTERLARVGYRRVVCVKPGQRLAEAVAIMQAERVGSVLVCEGGRLVGMLTDRHILRKLAENLDGMRDRVASCMVRDPVTVRRSDSIAEAICRMHHHRHRRLPVLDDDGTPLGVLSMQRIVRFLAEQLPSAVYKLPPRPGQFAMQREGA